MLALWLTASSLCAALMAPLQTVPRPDLGPPAALPLGNLIRVTGSTTRVGNVISAWYFAQLRNFKPALPAATVVTPLRSTMHHLGAMQCPGDDEMCFGRFLLAPREDGTEDVITPLANSTMRTLSSLRIYLQPIEGAPYAPEIWPLYRSDFLALVAEGLAKDLAPRMTAYAERYNPRLLAPPPSPTHCVVHYRAGDYGDFMRMSYLRTGREDPSRLPANWSVPMLSVDSVARAVASFVPPPETVEILNGEERRVAWSIECSPLLSFQIASLSPIHTSACRRRLSRRPNAREKPLHRRGQHAQLDRKRAPQLATCDREATATCQGHHRLRSRGDCRCGLFQSCHRPKVPTERCSVWGLESTKGACCRQA